MMIELHSWKPNLQLARVLTEPLPPSSRRYLEGDQQRKTAEQLRVNADTIVVAALRGMSSKVISAGFGVSDEAIMRRLRPLGLLNPPGVRGRPKKPRQLG